jgi:hypothetical protein
LKYLSWFFARPWFIGLFSTKGRAVHATTEKIGVYAD